ncbi:MAG: multidrug efflux SMR transporter [Desulfitobacterium sp.]|nr:multidrug efflux SMR transporter [Desulfitobacterium sp.]
MQGYMYLLGAILFEIAGTSMLKLSAGFTNLIPSIAVVIFFGISFTLFVYALKTVPLSLGYSIWSGLGTAGIGLIGVMFFNEVLSGVNILGLIIIILGIVIMNMGNKPDEETNSI